MLKKLTLVIKDAFCIYSFRFSKPAPFKVLNGDFNQILKNFFEFIS